MVKRFRGEANLFFASYDPRLGKLNRTMVPVVTTLMGRRSAKQRDEILILTKARRAKTWLPRAKQKPGILQKIHASNAGVKQIAEKLDGQYIQKLGEVLIGAQLDVNGKKETWVSPWARNFSEKYASVQYAEKILEQIKDNGDSEVKVRFYQELKRLHEINIVVDINIHTKATCSLLENEICNFRSGFNVWI